MWKYIKIFLAGCVFSLFYFPFEFSFLPGYNTKKILAAIGLVILLMYFITKKDFKLPRNVIVISIYAIVVSIIGLVAVVYNGTSDYVYSSYVISMWVWFSAAFASCSLIKAIHGKITVELLANYLIAICLFQCVAAQIINANASVKAFVDSYVLQGQSFLTRVNRLYGIGANLDVAGSRFAVALIVIVTILTTRDNLTSKELWSYIASYVAIAVMGSIIARTTYVGVVISLLFLICKYLPNVLRTPVKALKILSVILSITIFVVLFLVYLYNTDPQVYKMLRFAFEGFFNLAENGQWSIASNEFLKTMYVFPNNIKTWVIGDGYFNNPVNVDPYYVGEITGGYYMGTDVGYLRFIFYFGLLGLFAFIFFFIKITQYCIKGLPLYKWTFVLLLIANFTIWFKVSTDIFLVFALFLCVANMQDKSQEAEL